MRLDKFLANSSLGTRNEVKAYIKKGLVKVNDLLTKNTSLNINPNCDVVMFNDEIITFKQYRYFVFNKPKGYVSANTDSLYPTILEFFSHLKIKGLTHVGRLDKDTTGLIIITNHGVLAHRLISPKHHVDKVYEVTLDKEITHDLVKLFKEGVVIDDGYKTMPADTVITGKNTLDLTLREGKYHQVKRMCRAFGYEVINLHRRSFSFLTLKDLNIGEYYELDDTEIERLESL